MTRIIHIADLHFGDEDPALVANFLDQLPALRPDVVIVAGDLTQSGSRKEFAQAAEFLAAIDAPVVLTPGNHDTPLLNLAARVIAPWRRLQNAIGQHAADRLRSGPFHVESFNSARGVQLRFDWSLGVVSRRHLTRPLEALRNSDADIRILTAHHPVLSPLEHRGRARTRRAQKFTQEIAQSADLLLTGHLHRAFAIPVEAHDRCSWFIGASTAFSSRTREEPAGFNLIDGEPSAFSLTCYAADAGRFAPSEPQSLPRA